MDALLLLHPTERAIGYDGHGDFNITSEGQIAIMKPCLNAVPMRLKKNCHAWELHLQ
jgi:hypothetical protein